MKGEKQMIYKNITFKADPFSYDLVFDDRITLVGGDSGTGKTVLYEMLEDLRLTDEYKAIKLFNYKSDNILAPIKKCRNSFIVIDNADILINDEIRRFINFEFSNQYMLFLRNCDGLNVSDKNFKVLKLEDNRITLETVICSRNKILIKKATCKEAAMAAELALQMWEENTIEDLTREFTDYINADNSIILLAMSEDKPIGFAQCGLRHDYVEGTDSSPVGYLEGIFVVKEYRKKGIAREMLKECEIWAREQGCKEFASDCELINDTSLTFHLKMGFKEANRIICFTKNLE